MEAERQNPVEDIQRTIARLLATNPAGHNLLLIGGFRYRFLDRSVRTSRDMDYHWSGDFESKQQELVTLFRKRLLPSLRRQHGYEGSADPATGPDAESPAVRTVVVSLWKPGVGFSRLEVPVEITQVPCVDPTEVRTVDGAIYPTISDADMIESKIIAVLGRRNMAHRDLVDVFLFADRLIPDSPGRLRSKLAAVEILREDVRKRLEDLRVHAAYHTRALQAVVDGQLDPEAAANINAAGGARVILDRALEVLLKHPLPGGEK
jgi:hypothetical protein